MNTLKVNQHKDSEMDTILPSSKKLAPNSKQGLSKRTNVRDRLLSFCSHCVGSILFLSLVTGCFKPNYTRQYVDIPDSWRVPSDEGSTLCNYRWWEQFNDPILNDLIWASINNNLDLKIAMSRVLEFYARLGIADSALYPSVYGNASVTRNRTSSAIPLGFPVNQNHPFNIFQATVNLTWELDFWGRVRAATEAAYAELLESIANRRAVIITVVSSVANAYITLRGLDAQLTIAKMTLKSRQDSLVLARDRFQLGETSELEVVQAEAELEIAAIRELELELAIPLQENLLSVLLGQNPHEIIRGRPLNVFGYPPEIPAGIPSDLLTRRPDIVAAEDQLIALNARVTEVRTLQFPQFVLTGEYGSQSSSLRRFLTSPAQIWQYGVSLAQVIFDAGRIQYQIKAVEELRDQALHNYRQVILTAFQQVDDALAQVEWTKKIVAEHHHQVRVLEQYVNLATLRYLEGEVDYLNVLDSERSLFNAQLSDIQSQADSFNAVVSLYSALGGGWIDDIDAYITCQ